MSLLVIIGLMILVSVCFDDPAEVKYATQEEADYAYSLKLIKRMNNT